VPRLTDDQVVVTEAMPSKIEQAIAQLELVRSKNADMIRSGLEKLRAQCDQIGLRQVARNLGLDPGHLSRIIRGERSLPLAIVRAVQSNGI
jgi:hypothetical protein